jgi:acetyl xylan esterase AXE1
MNAVLRLTALVTLIVVTGAISAAVQESGPLREPRQQLIASLNRVAGTHLDGRRRAVAAVTSRGAAERRQAAVRQKLLKAIGGLPDRRGRPSVKTFGTVEADGFRVEKIAYESLPGFWVTANVYVPSAGSGPFPAIVVAPGHGAGGKNENWSWGGNFARSGIVALAYDPIGQGERLQYVDTATNTSYVGNPTGEHGMANIGPMLIGETVARYMVNDAMRGVDYLTDRPDVDDERIGAFGCSGGGTATAYFAALDERVKAAASACYITSFAALLPSATGVQEAEQSLPGFLSEGLDFADWVEAAAPRPYAIVSTQDDMFPFEGARQTYDEARRIYGLFGAADKLLWITGPGGHGNLGPVSQEILGFFTRHLTDATAAATFTPLRLERREELVVTPTGQVATSFGGETVDSLNRARAQTLMMAPSTVENNRELELLKRRLRTEIRALTGAAVQPSRVRGPVLIVTTEPRPGYRLDTLAIASDDDMTVIGFLGVPGASGRHPATILMPTEPVQALIAEGGELDKLARGGRVALALAPRPTPPGTESIKSPYLGIFNLLSLRAFLVRKTIVGLRIDDALRAVNWLSGHAAVSGDIAIRGDGPHGLVALHAAVLDDRIGSVSIRRALASYRMVLDQPGHRNVSEVMIPDVLRHYDVGDLLIATAPRRAEVIGPVDAAGAPLGDAALRVALANVIESEGKLETLKQEAPRLTIAIERASP